MLSLSQLEEDKGKGVIYESTIEDKFYKEPNEVGVSFWCLSKRILECRNQAPSSKHRIDT